MKHSRRALVIGGCAILLFVISFPAICQEGSAAIVEKIVGAVFLKQNGKAKEIRLNSRSDLARRLYLGDRVRCEKGASLRLRLGAGIKQITGPDSFTIPRRLLADSDPNQKALNEYGRIGGRDKGGGPRSLVYSPTDESVVMPETFVVRWIPPMRKCAASLVIQEPGGNEIWRRDSLDARVGSLDSTAARQALNTYRAKVGEGTLFLKLTDSCGHADQSRFDVLSLEDEQSLKNELASWNDETDKLIAHLGRASVFTSYKMFSQAVEEYEGALALAPQSHDLLAKTIDAQRRSGNRARADELEKSHLRSPVRGKRKPIKRL